MFPTRCYDEVCFRRLLEPSSVHLSLGECLDLAMADNIVSLLIQENYVNHRPIVASKR